MRAGLAGWILATGWAGASGAESTSPPPLPMPPNFVFILADDLGWTSLSGAMDAGQPEARSDFHETPTLDRLAREGMRFTRGFAPASICSPTRRSLQFGLTPARLGEDRFGEAFHPRTHPRLTIPRMLQAADPRYRTAHFGKWDLRAGIFPEDLGYDESDGDTGNSHGSLGSTREDKTTVHLLNNDPKRIETLTRRAENFIRRQHAAGHPFFLQISHYATHVDIQARPETYQEFKDKPPGRWHEEPGFAAMLKDLDTGVGRVLETLEELGLRENTYVIFMADNGGVEWLPQRRGLLKLDHPALWEKPSRNYPLRGGKWVLYEGGIRVPFFVRGPGVPAGSQTAEPVVGWDLLPTLAELAGYRGPLPEDLDGVSFAPLLAQPEARLERAGEGMVFHRYAQGYQHSALRTDRYKLIHFWVSGRQELYDLQADPEERHDLAQARPALRQELFAQLLSALREAQAEVLAEYGVPAEGGVAEAGADDGQNGGERPDFLKQSEPIRLEPFAGSEPAINPPTFRWPGDRKDRAPRFRLELARNADFREARVEAVNGFFWRPLEPLEPGTWWWRCRPENPEPGPWLGMERFEVSWDLPRWPLAPWEEWVGNIPENHPRIYLRAEEVEELRKRAQDLAAELSPWREDTRRELAKAYSLDEYIARVPDPKMPGVDPAQARKIRIWESKAAATAAVEPAVEGAWLWLATGDAWFKERVKERALLAASFDPEGFISEKNSGPDSGNIDFGNAVLVHDLGVIYDLLHAEFTPAERAALRKAIVARARPIFAKMRWTSLELFRAHAWQHGFLDALVGALAVYGEEPEARAWVEMGLQAFVSLYPWFGGPDGGSQEGPNYYYGVGLIPSLNTLDVLRTAFGLRMEEGHPWFRANPYFLVYSFPPGGLMTHLGDSNPGSAEHGDDRMTPGGKARLGALRMAQLYQNGFLAAYAAALPKGDREGLTVSEFLRWERPAGVPEQPLAGLASAHCFADTGTVFMHSRLADPEENVRLVFHASPYGGHGHAHADQNSFNIVAFNEYLVRDSGYYTPTGDPHREAWYVQTLAHNTVLVDGTGQEWGSNRGYARIREYKETEDWVYVAGDAARAYREAPLKRFDRHLVWLKGEEVQTYVLLDDLETAGEAARRFEWLLHAGQKMEVDAAAGQALIRGEKGVARVTLTNAEGLAWNQTTGFNVPAVYWRRGQNFPLPDQWHLRIGTPPATSARFAVVIQVGRNGAEFAPVEAAPDGVRVDGRVVRLAPGARRVEVGR